MVAALARPQLGQHFSANLSEGRKRIEQPVREARELAGHHRATHGDHHRSGEHLQGRKLVIDLSHATVIGQEGQDAILELMNEGAKFACCGVLTKYVVKQLARRCHGRMRGVSPKESIDSEPSITEVQVDAGKEHF